MPPRSMQEMLRMAKARQPKPAAAPQDPYDGNYEENFVRFTSAREIERLRERDFKHPGGQGDAYVLDDIRLLPRLTRAVKMGRANGAEIAILFHTKVARAGTRDYDENLQKAHALPEGATVVKFCYINQKNRDEYVFTDEEIAQLILAVPEDGGDPDVA